MLDEALVDSVCCYLYNILDYIGIEGEWFFGIFVGSQEDDIFVDHILELVRCDIEEVCWGCGHIGSFDQRIVSYMY